MLGRLWGTFFGSTADTLTPMPAAELNVLCEAIKKTDGDKVAQILQETSSHRYDVNTYTKYKFTPLHYALTQSKRGQNEDSILAILDLLYQHGADINKPANDRLAASPLHTAARRYQADMVRWLIDKGANIEVTDTSGQTPLNYVNKQLSNNSREELYQDLEMIQRLLISAKSAKKFKS